MVSDSDWNDCGPGLIPGRGRFVIYGIKTNGRRLSLLNCAADCVECYVSRTLTSLVHNKYPNVAQAAIPLYSGWPMCVPKGHVS